jgi:hypothetical protein
MVRPLAAAAQGRGPMKVAGSTTGSRIGLVVSTTLDVCTPAGWLNRRVEEAAGRWRRLTEAGAGRVLVGLPKNMDRRRASAAAARVR